MKELESLREVISTQPFLKWLGVELIDAGPGWVREKLRIRPEFLQPSVVHGGAIYSLADTAAAHSVLTLVYPAEWITTVEQKISFLKPVVSGAIICNARVIRLGKRICFSEAQIVDEMGEAIASSSATLMRLPR